MQDNKKKMSVSGFSYLAITFVLIFLMINTFFLLYSITHKDSINNKSLPLIFWIVEGLLMADLIWFVIIICLHKKSFYNTYSIWILFTTSLIGLFPLKLVIWFMHYFNYKKLNK